MSELKYTIKRKLYAMSKNEFFDTKYSILKRIKKSERTFENWMNTPTDSSFSIPVESFYIIAEELKCLPLELINNTLTLNELPKAAQHA